MNDFFDQRGGEPKHGIIGPSFIRGLRTGSRPKAVRPTIPAARAFRGLTFVVGCLLLCSGCKSGGNSNTTPSASVEIRGNTPLQVRDVAVQVFEAHEFSVVQRRPEAMVFEKPASKLRNFAYGGWVDEAPVFIRVKASVTPSAPETVRLSCRAFMVQDKGSPIEEEKPISSGRSSTYQKLLDEVAKRFSRAS